MLIFYFTIENNSLDNGLLVYKIIIPAVIKWNVEQATEAGAWILQVPS